jgi:hypothetical protein
MTGGAATRSKNRKAHTSPENVGLPYCAISLVAAPTYSGVVVARKQGNIAIAINTRATVA